MMNEQSEQLDEVRRKETASKLIAFLEDLNEEDFVLISAYAPECIDRLRAVLGGGDTWVKFNSHQAKFLAGRKFGPNEGGEGAVHEIDPTRKVHAGENLTQVEAGIIIASALGIQADQLMSIAEMEFQREEPEYRVRFLNGDQWVIAPGPDLKLTVTSPSGKTSLVRYERKLKISKGLCKLPSLDERLPFWAVVECVAFCYV